MVEGRTPVLTPAELFSEGLVKDPYPTYRRFLDAGPAHYVNCKRGTWAIFSHAGCATAIRDVRLTRKTDGHLLVDDYVGPSNGICGTDAIVRSVDAVYRRTGAHEVAQVMNRGFSPAVVESLRPQVETIVGRMLEPLMQVTEADLMQAIAYPLPMRVIAEMLGIPHTMETWLQRRALRDESRGHHLGEPTADLGIQAWLDQA